MSKLEDRINEILNAAYVMSFSTVEEGKPYSVWMHFARGDDWEIIVYSRPSRGHSIHLESNNYVAGAILPQQNPGYGVRGLSFQGTASRVTGAAELKDLCDRYCNKFGDDPDRMTQALSNDDDQHTYYRIRPSRFVLFSTENNPGETRQELKVNAKA